MTKLFKQNLLAGKADFADIGSVLGYVDMVPSRYTQEAER
jgi:hypothetical protein